MAAKAPISIKHRYDRRDIDNLLHGQQTTVFCLECKAYHRVQMGLVLVGEVDIVPNAKP